MSSEKKVIALNRLEELTIEEGLLSIAKNILKNLYGEEACMLLDYLSKNNYLAEETISDDIGIRSNEARKILQKMSDEALVIPDKLKVENNVLHIWKLNKPAIKTFVLNRFKKTKEKLEILLRRELENIIYECQVCKKRFVIDEAYTYSFQCPYDGSILLEKNDKALIEKTKTIISKIDRTISMLERARSD